MWRRAAWAALLSLFVLAFNLAQMPFAAPNVSKDFKAKFGSLNLIKCIAIPNHAEHDDFQRAGFISVLVFKGERDATSDLDRRWGPWSDNYHFLRKWTNLPQSLWRDDENAPLVDQIIRGGLASILQGNIGPQYAPLKPIHPTIFYENISSQLPLGSLITASNEADSGSPQHQRNDREQPFVRLDAEDRQFGSVLAATFTLLWATWVYLRGRFVLGWVVAAYAIFGLMLRLDLWSLAIRII